VVHGRVLTHRQGQEGDAELQPTRHEVQGILALIINNSDLLFKNIDLLFNIIDLLSF